MVPDWPSQIMVLEAGEDANTDTHPCVREGRLTDHADESCSKTQAKKNTAIICAISGNDSDARDFCRQLPQSFAHGGGVAQTDSASYIARWKRYVSK